MFCCYFVKIFNWTQMHNEFKWKTTGIAANALGLIYVMDHNASKNNNEHMLKRGVFVNKY